MKCVAIGNRSLFFFSLILALVAGCSKRTNVTKPATDLEEFYLKKFVSTASDTTANAKGIRYASPEETIFGVALFGNHPSQYSRSCSKWGLLLHGAVLVAPIRTSSEANISDSTNGTIIVSATTDSTFEGFIFQVPLSNGNAPEVSITAIVSSCDGQEHESASLFLNMDQFQNQNGIKQLRFRRDFQNGDSTLVGLILRGPYKLKNTTGGSTCTAQAERTEVAFGESVSFTVRSGFTSATIDSIKTLYLFQDAPDFKLARDGSYVKATETARSDSGPNPSTLWRFDKRSTAMANQEDLHLSRYPGGMMMTFRISDTTGKTAECSTSIRFRSNQQSISHPNFCYGKPVNQSFPSPDGCNSCMCDASGQGSCTLMACAY